MELLPAVTAWLDSRTRVLKKNVADAIENPVEFVDKQVTNFNEDMRPDQVLELEQWKKALLGQGKGLLEGEAATAVLGKAFGPAGMAAAQATSVLTPMLVGAFRPVGSKLLPSTLQGIKKGITPVPYEGPRGWDNGGGDNPPLGKIIQGKISDKALQKYGTSEFPLDPYLAHVRGGLSDAEYFKGYLHATELPLSVYRQDAQDYIEQSALLRRHEAAGKPIPQAMKNGLLAYKDDLRAYRSALAEKVPVFEVGKDAGVEDILDGAYNLGKILGNSPYSDDQLSKKSLEQLVSIGKKTEAAQLKEASVIKDFTVKRSAQLNQEQGLPKGFIELKTQQDLGAETEFMNNCVGAGGAHPRTGKFLPKWHPITGEQITKGFAEDSGDQYWKRLQSGNERIFSYRPEGLPVATIRIDSRTGSAIEALGIENQPIPESMTKVIQEFHAELRESILKNSLTKKPTTSVGVWDLGF